MSLAGRTERVRRKKEPARSNKNLRIINSPSLLLLFVPCILISLSECEENIMQSSRATGDVEDKE